MATMIKTIIAVVAMTVAITLILTTKNSNYSPTDPSSQPSKPASQPSKPAAGKRLSRFLEQNEKRNPRAADHCNKDNEICSYILEGRNATCCNNKCVDLKYDSNNCGACKKKCAFTETCCRGECVNLSYDKRHCSFCNNRCMPGGYCIYGMCDYA